MDLPSCVIYCLSQKEPALLLLNISVPPACERILLCLLISVDWHGPKSLVHSPEHRGHLGRQDRDTAARSGCSVGRAFCCNSISNWLGSSLQQLHSAARVYCCDCYLEQSLALHSSCDQQILFALRNVQLMLTVLQKWQVAGSWQYGNELLGPKRCREILDYLKGFVSHNNRTEGKLHVEEISSAGGANVVIILACVP